MPNTHKKNAFSLVELAIVLVILGLLAGGVLTGQVLIRNAELQSVITEVNGHKDAVAQFQSKYNDLPGDMSDAEDYWGQLAGVNCQNSNVINDGTTGRETCNGNGNGQINHADMGDNFAQEWFHAWVHLRNAGFVDGLFTGRRVANDRQAVPGTNIPRSTLDDGGYTLMSLETSSTAGWWNGDYNPAFIFGKQNGNVESGGAILLPEEAWNIDTKMDDARPGTGKVRTYRNSSNCNTSLTIGDQATSEYALATSVAACSLIFAISDPGV